MNPNIPPSDDADEGFEDFGEEANVNNAVEMIDPEFAEEIDLGNAEQDQEGYTKWKQAQCLISNAILISCSVRADEVIEGINEMDLENYDDSDQASADPPDESRLTFTKHESKYFLLQFQTNGYSFEWFA